MEDVMKEWEKVKKEWLVEPERDFVECVQAIVLLHHKAQTCTVYLRTWHFPKMSVVCEFDWRQYNQLQAIAEEQASGQSAGVFKSNVDPLDLNDQSFFEIWMQGDMQRADIDEDTSIVTMDYFGLTLEGMLRSTEGKNLWFEMDQKQYTILNVVAAPVRVDAVDE
ncbi:hypothetical protein [uncultured Selenomonas sp.]|uniref:hypothetical protein n=1 Tax=uncultured Selenomonas sp. TaxID=159275 RepID=UPI0025FC8A9B|nr:hypothetical protein [uncultured Selenomonas sp.]